VDWYRNTCHPIVRGVIQFQKGLSLSEFHRLYGSEENCEAALEKARWPDGFCWPRCADHENALVYGRCLNRYQCGSCGLGCSHHMVPGFLSNQTV